MRTLTQCPRLAAVDDRGVPDDEGGRLRTLPPSVLAPDEVGWVHMLQPLGPYVRLANEG